MGHPLEREAVGHDAAAVDGGRHRRGVDLRGRRDLCEAAPAGRDATRAGTRRSASLARDTGAASRRASPSSCARSSSARGRTRGRPPWRSPSRAGSAPARADRADGDERRKRSRSPRRRDRVAHERRGAPATAWPNCGTTSPASCLPATRPSLRPRPPPRARGARASTTSPRCTSTVIASTRAAYERG